MTAQDCPNCHYPMPDRGQKKDKAVPQTPYQAPEEEKTESCPQCFYQPEEKEEEKTDSCPQCFYQPEEKEEEKSDGCSQCFYQPNK